MLDCKYLFFFSRRIRHTRSLCDWSSDVCSSDLLPVVVQMTIREDGATPTGTPPEDFARLLDEWGTDVIGLNCSVGPARSEERRVGKESSLRGTLVNIYNNNLQN